MKLSRIALAAAIPAILIGITLASAQQERPFEPDTRTVHEKIVGKTRDERRKITGKAVADSNPIGTYTNSTHGVQVQITDIKEFPAGGVEVLARAWRGGKQIGFGKDGSVDLERFRILDPRMAVPDPNGAIQVQSVGESGQVVVTKYREDPKAALREEVAMFVNRAMQNPNGTIVEGKIGSTTTTCRPEAGVAGTTTDGRAYRTGDDNTWTSVRNAAGNAHEDTVSDERAAVIQASATTNQYSEISRYIATADCSAGIGDTDSVDSFTFSFYVTSKFDSFTSSVVLVGATPGSNNDLANSDYGQVGSTAFSATVAISAISTNAFMDLVGNDTGKSAISKTGITGLGIRIEQDRANSEPSWSSNGVSRINGHHADTALTTTDPVLVVSSSPAPASAGGGKTNRVIISM